MELFSSLAVVEGRQFARLIRPHWQVHVFPECFACMFDKTLQIATFSKGPETPVNSGASNARRLVIPVFLNRGANSM